MDSSQFLSYFWGLSKENSNEQIIKSAESIVNLVEYEQKFGNKEKEKPASNIKYKLYLNICENPTEDLLYTMKRLIGGIASTGIESRRGFLLTFNLMLEKFSNLLNFYELVNIIEKESTVSKSEKNHIKNCSITGKVLMLKSVLDVSLISSDVILHVFRLLCDMLNQPMYQIAEEPILLLINDFFRKSAEVGFYSEFENTKKFGRFLEKLFNLFGKILNPKSRFENMKKLSEISLFFVFAKYNVPNNQNESQDKLSEILSNCIRSHFSLSNDFLNYLGNYFKSILAKNLKDNEFHISFGFLLEYLKRVTDIKKVYSIWNLLIDQELQTELKTISLKNYQLLLYNFSRFIIQNAFVLNYVKEIFDASFFEGILKFSSSKKFKYINGLIEALTTGLNKAKENGEAQTVSDYSENLLQIFGSDPSRNLSPQSYKNFLIFLFNNLEEGKKLNFVEKQSNTSNSNEELQGEEEVEEYEDFLYKLTVLKQLIISRDAKLDESLKHKILEFFFKQNFDNPIQKFDVEFENIIEDRLLLVIFAYFKIESISSTENRAKTSSLSVPDKKVVKSLMKVNKLMQKMIKSNSLENVDLGDFKSYAKFYNKFSALVPGKGTKSSKTDNSLSIIDERVYSILKIAFVVLILYVKNPEEYSDILSDLLEITKFDENWTEVYTDIILSLIHKGNTDWVMNNFRKMSKYMNKKSFNIICEFLMQKNEDESKEAIKGLHEKKEVEMFEDMNEEMKNGDTNTYDVEMD